jgi:ABC-type oligopeptide transport system substrate-binding subunit/class 3 adenylate cyclase
MTDSPKISCNNCAFENPEDAKFCQNCGNPLMLPCPACNTLNSAGVKFCKNCGHALTETTTTDQEPRLKALKDAAPKILQEKLRAAKSEIDGERKPVTILFADIVGSTAMAEQLDPEEWKEIVNGTHQRLSEAIYRYEGTIAQLLGDGLLAFFGAPVTHEDDPIRAVLAAIAIQDAIQNYEEELTGLLDQFKIRIGINSGTVVIGDIGSDLHVEYLAIGDAVNIAARLQSAAEPGKVLLSDSSSRLVKSAFDLHELGEIDLKGREGTLSAFEVIQPKPVLESQRGIEGLHSPLIGRQHEMNQLNQAFSELCEGRGQIIALMGEAGIGKSRLLEETRIIFDAKRCTEVQSEKPTVIRWLEGRALSYGSGLPFWPITQVLLSDLGLSDGDPKIRIRTSLNRRVEDLFGNESNKVLPFLVHLLGVRQSDEDQAQVDRLDSETLKHQIVISLEKYLEKVSLIEPTALIIEDLHWADPSTIDTLDHLLRLTDRIPLMILLVMRVDREHGSHQLKMKSESEYAYRFSEIELKRLSSNDSDELINQLLEVAEFPQKIRDLILSRSDGNPFYLEEIIRNLIDEGVIIRQEDTWQAISDVSEVSIPETLHGVLLARIDRLEEEVRSTLQVASVIGKSFLYRLLEAISEAEMKLETHLTALQRADLVREKSRWPELEYMFKHSLTQEAAYESLLVERRKRFHLQVGEAIESLFPDRQEEFLGLLAHHFECAGEGVKALDYLLRAGDKARLEDSLKEAADYYQRALEMMNHQAQPSLAAHTWLKLGLIHQMNFHFEAAREASEAAFSLGSVSQDPLPVQQDVNGQVIEHSRKLRFCTIIRPVSIDPGKAFWTHEAIIIRNVFAGLAELDSDTNVVPHVAKSWEVRDGGKRYVFHLRDDVRWTNGSFVTADDFEFAWKRNLAPATASSPARLLDDVLGARDYRTGKNPDSDSVGIRTLDKFTLEVLLERPVAYFIYLATQGVTFPLPRNTIEQFGDDWWLPENIVTNGAYRLTRFNESGIELDRNYNYFDIQPDNVDGMNWWFVRDEQAALSEYVNGNTDLHWDITSGRISSDISPDEIHYPPHDLGVRALVFNPSRPPLDDIRVRRAIVHALDRKKLHDAVDISIGDTSIGGLIPLGLAGHTPGLGLPHNLDLARQYLTEAGYPSGKGFPDMKFSITSSDPKLAAEYQRQLRDGLGITVHTKHFTPRDSAEIHPGDLNTLGWAADYPDPDNFLHKSSMITNLRAFGWTNHEYESLIEAAAILQDRSKRLNMYRQADKILVRDEVLVYPVGYAGDRVYADLIKPWVKNFKRNALGYARIKDIRIEVRPE